MKRLTTLLTAVVLSLHLTAENYLELAAQAGKEGKYEAVVEYTTQHLSTSPKDAAAYYYRAVGYATLEEYGKALKDVKQAIAFYNKKCADLTLTNLYALRAMIYEQIEDYEKALADYNTAVKKDKNNVEAYTNRAEYYYRMDEYALAEQDYRKAAMLQPDNSEWQIEMARCRLAQALYEDARAILKPLTKLEPRNEEARRLLALVYLYQDQKQTFVDHYLIYLDLADGGDLTPLAMVAANGAYSYVIKAITRMLATTDNKTYWYGVRARIYRENKHYEEALGDLQKMEQAYGDSIENPFVYYQMAKCYDGLYDFTKAVGYYSKLIHFLGQTNRLEATYYLDRANAYCNQGDIDKALTDTESALSLATGGSSVIYFYRGWFYEMVRNYKAAFEEYNKAITMDDGVFHTLYLLRGKNYLLHQQDTARANADFETVLGMDTLVAEGSCRHYALAYLGRYVEAKAWMNRLLETNPDAGNYYDAACLYSRMGEAEQAVAYLRKAFELGYRSLVHIIQDNDLDAIRERDDFKELLQQYQKEKVKSLLEQLTF
ncbi:MAG: TPR end-of-group domain-containing protein [Paludibacteraceae bacterium]